MGKMTSLYLTAEEASDLEEYCEEYQCSQYSVLKNALREFLSNARIESGKESVTIQENEGKEEQDEVEQQERKLDITEFFKRLLETSKN
jgi:hypothetical protein